MTIRFMWQTAGEMAAALQAGFARADLHLISRSDKKLSGDDFG